MLEAQVWGVVARL